MTINEYQTAALRTAQTDKLTANELLLNSALGLCGESGEVADLVKKHRFQGHDLDFDHVAKELGDISWYLAVGAYSFESMRSELSLAEFAELIGSEACKVEDLEYSMKGYDL